VAVDFLLRVDSGNVDDPLQRSGRNAHLVAGRLRLYQIGHLWRPGRAGRTEAGWSREIENERMYV
jgi:hypothetical protein